MGDMGDMGDMGAELMTPGCHAATLPPFPTRPAMRSMVLSASPLWGDDS